MKDQRNHGACTGFGTERVVRMALKQNGKPDIDLSPLFAYFNNRMESGLPTTQDTGATIAGSIAAAKKYGLCREPYWTYTNADGYLFVKPEWYAYEDGLLHQVLDSYPVPNNPDAIRQALASGYGVTLGSTVFYQAFEYAPNGDVTMPQSNDSVAGAHNYVLDGWDDDAASGMYDFGNSWGPRWGNGGFGRVPYDYISRFAFDLHAVKLVESPEDAAHIVTVSKTDGTQSRIDNAKAVTVDNRQVWP